METTASRFVLADFNTQDPAETATAAGTKVLDARATAARNLLDGTRALEYTCLLEESGAAWGGCRFAVPAGQAPAGADTIAFDACSTGATTALFVTVTERDGARWKGSVRLTRDWTSHSLPRHRLRWAGNAPRPPRPAPDFATIAEIQTGVEARWQGPNGFAIDNLTLADTAPDFKLRCASPTTVSLQRATSVTLQSIDPHSGTPVPFTGTLHLGVEDRESCLYPGQVRMTSGTATFDIFPRTLSTLRLYVYEPLTQYETALDFGVLPDSFLQPLKFAGYDGQQVIGPRAPVSPTLQLTGNLPVPLSAHIEIRNRLGTRILSRSVSVAELFARKVSLSVPEPGISTVHVRFLSDPVGELPRVEDNRPVPLDNWSTSTIHGDGITTDIVMATVVTLEDLPSTATVLAEDRFTLYTLTAPLSENILYRSPFGIGGERLAAMSVGDIKTEGNRLLSWHRRLGSYWGRDDLAWQQADATSGTLPWEKADAIVSAYRENRVKLLGTLGPAADGTANAPAGEAARAAWGKWCAALIERFKRRVYAYELWNKPNTAMWRPAPDPTAYRELMKATHDALRPREPGIPLVAGATEGFDPAFTQAVVGDGYDANMQALSIHPRIDRHHEPPEENELPRQCAMARDLLARMNTKERTVWLTELAWASCPAGCSEMEQANYLVRAYTLALMARISKIFWLGLQDGHILPWRGDPGEHTGLLDARRRPKPAAVAYNLVAYMLAQSTPRNITQQGRATICSFDVAQQSSKWPGAMHVAWTPAPGDEEVVELTMRAGGPVFALDFLGAQHQPVNPCECRANDTRTTRTCRFRVTHEPLYIWDSGLGKLRERQTRSH